GTNFSRRNARHPLPPSPAFIKILTSSMNTGVPVGADCLLSGANVDEPAQPATIAEFNGAADFREQRVVLSETDIQTGLDFGAALANYDRSARYQLTAEGFHAQTLRVRIAPVF